MSTKKTVKKPASKKKPENWKVLISSDGTSENTKVFVIDGIGDAHQLSGVESAIWSADPNGVSMVILKIQSPDVLLFTSNVMVTKQKEGTVTVASASTKKKGKK